MKKLLFLSATALSFTGFGQVKNSIKVDPVSIIVGGGTNLVSYERSLDDHSTIGAGVGFATFKVDDYKYNFMGIEGFYRYYTKQAFQGLFFSGSLGVAGGRAKYTLDKSNTLKDKYTTFYVSGLIGYQWVWKSGFTLDLHGGVTYLTLNYKEDKFKNNAVKAKADILAPALGIGLGYSFK